MKILFTLLGIIIVAAGVLVYFNQDAKETLLNLTKGFNISQEDTGPQPLSKEEVTHLIKNDMQRFAISVNNKDMSEFYSQISDFWQKKTSVTALNEVFAPFIDSGIDLTVLKNMNPLIDKEPKITNRSDLKVAGHYNTTPSVLHFEQTYFLQDTGEWKLSAFFIEVKKK